MDQRRAYWILRAVRDAGLPVIPVDWFIARMENEADARALHALYESRVKFYLHAQEAGHAP